MTNWDDTLMLGSFLQRWRSGIRHSQRSLQFVLTVEAHKSFLHYTYIKFCDTLATVMPVEVESAKIPINRICVIYVRLNNNRCDSLQSLRHQAKAV